MRAARRGILRSMPGLGRIILAVVLAEVWQPLRRRDYHALRGLSGVAPVTRRSGKTCVVVRSYACNKRLANALYHWARLATQHDALSRRRYAALRQRGHSHGRALRPLAVGGLHPARTADAVRPHLRGSRGRRRVSIRFHPFVRSKAAIPSSRPASRQSAARSGSQGCRRECGGIGGAGAKRP